jgi:hypothetical protein
VDSIEDILNLINSKLKKCMCLSSLTLLTHGNARGPRLSRTSGKIDPNQLGELLKPILCPGARINMFHCAGKGLDNTFAPALAKASGASVVGVSGGDGKPTSGTATRSTDPDKEYRDERVRTRFSPPEVPYPWAKYEVSDGGRIYLYHPDGSRDDLGKKIRSN